MTAGFPWHPVFVHFPLALVVTAALCLLAARLFPSVQAAEALALVGTWNLCLGAIALLFALGSGLAAVLDLHVGEAARAAISAHLKSAIVTTILVLAVGLWRGFGVPPRSRPSLLFVLLLGAATVSLLITGYRGGQNVYRYAIGVSEVKP